MVSVTPDKINHENDGYYNEYQMVCISVSLLILMVTVTQTFQ